MKLTFCGADHLHAATFVQPPILAAPKTEKKEKGSAKEQFKLHSVRFLIVLVRAGGNNRCLDSRKKISASFCDIRNLSIQNAYKAHPFFRQLGRQKFNHPPKTQIKKYNIYLSLKERNKEVTVFWRTREVCTKVAVCKY
jgi:hypothetical protein